MSALHWLTALFLTMEPTGRVDTCLLPSYASNVLLSSVSAFASKTKHGFVQESAEMPLNVCLKKNASVPIVESLSCFQQHPRYERDNCIVRVSVGPKLALSRKKT
jgi:hypothetical protein